MQVAIAVPVRNEARHLPRLLAALVRQDHAHPFTLCVHLDNCGDASAALLASWAKTAPFAIQTSEDTTGRAPNAGIARRQAMALAQRRSPDGVLLTTDADSEPARNWITANLAALDHADIVAGRIVRGAGPPCPLQGRIERYLDRLHALRRSVDRVAWEAPLTHHWTSAASLAMPAAIYARIGGIPPRATGEDAALVDTAARLGFRTRRDAAVLVRTSARRQGRIEGGFASALQSADEAKRLPDVAHPEDEAWRYAHHAMARALHGSGDYAGLARRVAVPLAEVGQVASECRNGEAFAARIVGAPPGGMRPVPLSDAERLLDRLEGASLKGAA